MIQSRNVIPTLAVVFVSIVLPMQSAFGATAQYFDVNGSAAGFGTPSSSVLYDELGSAFDTTPLTTGFSGSSVVTSVVVANPVTDTVTLNTGFGSGVTVNSVTVTSVASATTTLTTGFASGATVTSVVVTSATGIVPGEGFAGTGVPAGVTVTSVSGTTINVTSFKSTAASGTGNYTFGTIFVGEGFYGTGVPPGVVVLAISGNTITLSSFTSTAASDSGNDYTFGIGVGNSFVGTGVPTNVVVTAVSGSTINVSSFTSTAASTGNYTFGYPFTWSTSSAGSVGTTAFTAGDAATFGAAAGDSTLSGTITINNDLAGHLNGITLNSVNLNVTLLGNANTFVSAASTFFVNSSSTLTINTPRQGFDAGGTGALKGMNYNNQAITLTGGGTINFPSPIGCNSSSALWTENMSGGTVNFEMANNAPSGAGTYVGGFTLQNGRLNFASPGSANQFYGFTSGKLFTITNGTIDNTSGSPLTLNFAGGGGISVGGSFTFAGTGSLNLSTAPVTLTATPTITVNANTLTIPGNVTGAFGLTEAGSGVLALTGTDGYTGATTINSGTLLVGGSLASSTVSVGGGALSGNGTISGSVSTTSASAQINQESNYLENATVGTLAVGGNLNLSGGGTCSLDLSTSFNSGNDLITVAGALTLGSGTVFHINALSGAADLDTTGDYVLIQGSSAPTGSVNPVPVWDGTPPANKVDYTVLISGNNVVLHYAVPGQLSLTAEAIPADVSRYQSTVLTVTVTNGVPPYTVMVDASSIGGSSSLGLVQDTAEPAGVYIFTNSIMPAAGVGNYLLPVTANDSASGTANGSISLNVIGAPLTWNGDASGNSYWDTAGELEWQNGDSYQNGDFVTFNDTAAGLNFTNVNLLTSLSPGSITVNNTAGLPSANYTFAGSGNIYGTTGLLKEGSGTLTLQENSDSFSGGINVAGGTVVLDQPGSSAQGGATIASGAMLQVGNNDANGILPSGTVADNGTLLFDQTNNATVANDITGDGVVEQFNTNIVTLSGISTGNWSVTISNGTLQAANNTALGSIPGGAVTITNGGTFDLGGNTTANNADFTNKLFNVSGAGVNGNGAIVNNSSGVAQENGVGNVVLTSDATFGGTSRWDIRNSSPLLNLAGYTLTKTNANQISLVGAHVTSGNIIIQQGIMSFEETPNFDVSSGTITAETNGYVGQYKDTLGSFTRSIVLNGGGTTNLSAGGTTFLDAPILLTADSSLGTSGGIEFFDNVISDGGSGFGLTQIGVGTNLLAGTNTYSGGTAIASGALALTNHGSIAKTAFIMITNSGTFDVSGLSIPFTGANTLYIGDVTQGQGTFVAGVTAVTYGSVSLSNAIISMGVTNPAPTTANIIFTNLNFGGSDAATINISSLPQTIGLIQFPLIKYINSVGTYTVNLGSLPSGFSANLVNDTANNSIDLAITGTPPGVWNGGDSAVDNNWSDSKNWRNSGLTGTDPLTFTGTAGLDNTNDQSAETANSIIFASGAGAFVLNGNPVTLAGGITNQSTSTQTINLGLSFNSAETFNAAAGTLIIGGGLTNAAPANTNNTLTLLGNGILTNLLASVNTSTNTILLNSSSADWTLMDNSSSTQITVPWVLNDDLGTFNFGGATSAPNLSTTTVNGGPQDNIVGSLAGTSTFNMSNGTYTTTARLNTGVATNASGIINQYGGTLTIGSQFQGANANGGISAVNISGGTINIGSVANPASPFYVASRGTGTLTVSGSGTLNCGTLDLSRSINSSIAGTVNLNSGGTIVASLVSTATANATTTATGSTGTLNFNGGTLRAYTNAIVLVTNSPASPLVPLNAVVKAGGALIDSSSNTIIFAEALNTDPSLGGAEDGGLTKLGSGTLTLTMANTYNGNTTISDGTLALSGSGSVADSTNIVIAGGATLDVSALASYTLGLSQVVSNSASTALIGGNFNADSGTLSLTYAAGTPSLSSTNGTLTLATTTVLKINNTGVALPAGAYTIITSTTGGSVAGVLPTTFTVGGGGIAAGATASLQLSGGALNLVVTASALPPPPKIQHITISGGNIVISGTNNNGAGGTYHVLTSTNVALPVTSWTVLTNGSFDGAGNFSFTNAVGTSARQFYLLQVP